MAKREKVSCARVHALAHVASASRSLKLLPRNIALTLNFRRLKSYRAIVVLNTAPPPPPPAHLDYTGVCRWPGYGFWSLSLNMVYNFMRIFPNRVWLVRSTFHFVFLNMVRVSNPQREPCIQTLIKCPPSSSSPPPRGSGATLQNLQSRTF